MSIQHLTNPTENESKLSVICNNGNFVSLDCAETVTCTSLNAETVTCTTLNSDTVNSNNCNISNNLTTKNFQINDTLMIYNESKVNAKIFGETTNFVITDGTIFKTVVRQDSQSHYIKKYTYIMNAQNIANISSLGCTLELEPFEYGNMIMTGYSIHYDVIVSNNNQYHGVLIQSGQNVSLSVQIAPPPLTANNGRLYIEFFTVLQK